MPIASPSGHRRLSDRLRGLVRDVRGATIIEFAVVVAPFLALLLAVLQMALIYFVQEALETAVETSARSIITGKAQAADISGASSGMTSAQLQARFKTAACKSLPDFLSCSNLFVEVRSAGSWNELNTDITTLTYDSSGNVSNSFSYSLGTQGSVILVRLMYLWPIEGAPMELGLANAGRGKRLIYATSVAKTESYS